MRREKMIPQCSMHPEMDHAETPVQKAQRVFSEENQYVQKAVKYHALQASVYKNEIKNAENLQPLLSEMSQIHFLTSELYRMTIPLQENPELYKSLIDIIHYSVNQWCDQADKSAVDKYRQAAEKERRIFQREVGIYHTTIDRLSFVKSVG